MRQPAFVENSLGYNLFIGYHPEGDGGFVSRIAIIPMNILDDGERDRFCMQQAIEFIRQNPGEAARRIWVRLVKFMGPEDREFFYFYSNNQVGPISQPWLAFIYSLLVIPWLSTLTFGAIGLWHKRENKIALLAVLYLVGYGLPHLFIIAEPRFHLAWIPVLIPFAADGWLARKEVAKELFHNKGKWVLVVLLLLIVISFLSGFASNFTKLTSIMRDGGNSLSFPY